MISSIKPSLFQENQIIGNAIKKKKLELLINYSNSFNLSEDNKNKFLEFLSKESKKNKSFLKISILIISNMSYQIFDRLIKESFLINKSSVDIHYINYNEFLSLKKEKLKYDCIFVFFDKNDLEEISSFSNSLIYTKKDLRKIENFYNFIFTKLEVLEKTKIFLSNLSAYENTEFYSLEKKVKNNKSELIDNLNNYILKKSKKHKFNLIDIESYSKQFGLINIQDTIKFYLAKIPFSQEFAEHFLPIVINFVLTSFGKLKKVLVLDLDNTLWGGILGDEGYENIKIDNETPEGKVFFDFQKTILNLKKRGVLLAICSKNFDKNVKAAFKNNTNLVLRYNDFVSIKANWNNKAENIKNISKELGLGLDSFVFFDDNPAERELVRSFLPNVTIPELPSEPCYYRNILLNNFYFDLVSLSKEDISRSKSYITNVKREKLKEKFSDFNEYLKSLKMECEHSEFKKGDYDRIVQLFLRSNQFNFTTIRYSLKDIHNIRTDKNRITFQFSFRDKFSNYGIVSLIVGTITKDCLFIDNWVMSCRVLNRTLEIFIINSVIKYAKTKKIKKIIGIHMPTQKNFLVEKLYIDLGFSKKNNTNSTSQFLCDVRNSQSKKTPILEKK